MILPPLAVAGSMDDLPITFPGIHLISPMQDAVVRPGQELPVRIEVDPALNARSVLIAGNIFRTGISLAMEGPPFTGSLTIPNELAGTVKLVAIVLTDTKKSVGGFSLRLNVVPEETPRRIYNPKHFYLKLPPDSFVGSRTIYTKGIYDGVERNISDPVTGTRYHSMDTSVATVNAQGVLEPVAPGRAYVVVEHRGLKGYVEVEVEGEGKTVRDFAPVDQTAAVNITASAPRKRPGTVRYEIDVVIRNDADLPLALPLHLVITGLAEGVRVADAEVTSRVEPHGSPYVFVDVDEQMYLSPGKSTKTKVEFINFDDKPLQYRLRLFSGNIL